MMHSVIKNKGTILPVLLVMAGVSVFFMSCVEKKMTLKEAKQVSVSMRQSSFVPPPRSIDDILSVLNQPGKFNKNITAAIVKKADAKPPDTDDPGTLAEFFRDRGTSAKDLGRSDQELQDARTALSYARKTDKMTPKGMSNLLKHLGSAEVRLGNFKTGQAVLREGIDLFPTGSHYHLLAETLFKVGDFKGGSQLIKEGIDFCNKHEEKSGGKRSQKIQADRARLNAIYYGSLGQYKKAEMYWREFQTILETAKANRAAIFLMSNYFLAKNLKSQGRLIEAELQIREGLKGAVAHAGKNSGLTASMASFFAEILLDQGRIDDAQKIILASIDCYEKAGVRKDSLVLSKAKVLLGGVAFARKDFQGATKQFQDVKKDMALNQYYYNTKIMQNHNMMICFLISGHVEDTMNS
ncbi:MAG: hypothetical protein KKE44_07135, partial [Proteobacteria bacterium]|nr:hypothetical protein [Pseudomonadota bacterium]MBU1582503.1 hypothetical protein [Pseudomonadota bacterium]